jgi:hypothetical protein
VKHSTQGTCDKCKGQSYRHYPGCPLDRAPKL